MKNKQTAVEWLADVLHGFIHPEHGKDFLPILEKAKAMEKEQIIEAYCKPTGMKHSEKWVNMFRNKAEQYYNETYGK